MLHKYSTYFSCLLFLICIDTSQQSSKKVEVEGYFWRDYAGFIPHDAVPGGNEKGSVTYIGQALYNNLLVPAKIVPAEGKVYFEWGRQEHSAEENVKILCSEDPKRLKWLSSSGSEFRKIKSKRFIVGGYEPNSKLYIGRLTKKGEVLVGKLLVNEFVYLHTTLNGKAVESTTDFEVLYYYSPKDDDDCVATTKGYYWRDYVGVIPKDALPAGIEGETTTYIAEVLYRNLLVPGKIIEADKTAYFEWGLQAHTAEEDIKIFCTDTPDNFHWLSTDSLEFRNIKGKRFVVASHEGEGTLYIGRIKIGKDKIVGKLLVNNEVIFHAVNNGHPIQGTEFEVLYYEPPEEEETAVHK